MNLLGRNTPMDIDKAFTNIREVLIVASDDGDWTILPRLHALALEILAATTRSEPTLRCTLEWHSGCHCHGNDLTDVVESPDINGMARQLAGHGHANKSGLPLVHRVMDLTYNEEEELKTRFTAWQVWHKILANFDSNIKKGADRTREFDRDIENAQFNLCSIKADLLPEALAFRQAAITALIEARAQHMMAQAEAMEARALHVTTTP